MIKDDAIYEFKLGDVEDPHLYAQLAINDWAEKNSITKMLRYSLIDAWETEFGWKVKVYAS